MDQAMYPTSDPGIAARRNDLALGPLEAFKALSDSAFADCALPAKTKQLIAVAVAHVTQCPYSIRGHTPAALKSGSNGQKIIEAIWVAAEMRGGAVNAHSPLALDTTAANTNTNTDTSTNPNPNLNSNSDEAPHVHGH
jgi:AhpD family alkylhydroperoxidase